MRSGTVLISAVVAGCLGGSVMADRVVLLPERLLTPEGALVADLGVVVEDGLIVRVDDASALADDPDAVRVEGVLSPGLISLASSLGVSEANATSGSVLPELRVADSFDPSDPALLTAARSGVTGAMVIPPVTNLVCGTSAFVSTHASGGEWFIDADGPMVFGFGPTVYDLDLGPTSRSGALGILRQALDRADRGEGDPRLIEALEGERGAVAYCPAIDDVDAAFRVFDRFGVEIRVIHNEESRLLAEALESTPTRLAMGPYGFTTPSWVLAGAGQVAETGSSVALIGGDGTNPGLSLRTSASLAVRYGLDAEQARRGMTRIAAEYAGVEGSVGSIERGKRADLVVFSGDPLRLDSSVDWVMIGGEWLVRPGAPTEEETEFDFSTTMMESEGR